MPSTVNTDYYKNFEGQKINKYTILSYNGYEDRKHIFACRCDCDAEKVVKVTTLKAFPQSCQSCSNGLVNMKGQRIGKLLVLGRSTSPSKWREVRWDCRCDCGKEIVVKGSTLRRGKQKSCGCISQPPYLGRKFGLLTVIKKSPRKAKKGYKSYWMCKCECGNMKEIANYSIGKTKSCGCLRNKTGTNNPRYKGCKLITGTIWADIVKGANSRDIEFSLRIEEAWEVFESQKHCCALSGLPLSMGDNKHRITRTASIDRIDSDGPYSKDNIQWVHKDINRMKGCFDQSHFIDMCKSIAACNHGQKYHDIPLLDKPERITRKGKSHEWFLWTPEGYKIKIRNLADFCRLNDLDANTLHKIGHGKGHVNQHKGWKCEAIGH